MVLRPMSTDTCQSDNEPPPGGVPESVAAELRGQITLKLAFAKAVPRTIASARPLESGAPLSQAR
jgi:hypothetical protein